MAHVNPLMVKKRTFLQELIREQQLDVVDVHKGSK